MLCENKCAIHFAVDATPQTANANSADRVAIRSMSMHNTRTSIHLHTHRHRLCRNAIRGVCVHCERRRIDNKLNGVLIFAKSAGTYKCIQLPY